MMRWTLAAWVGMALVLGALEARADSDSPIGKGRFHFSGGAGFAQESFSIGAGVGYFFYDGLMPGARYRYTRFSDKHIDDKASLHDLNVYVRYYFDLASQFYPFVVADVGYLKMLEWGTDVANRTGEMFSIMGGGGAAYYVSRNFFVELSAGMRRYIDPPTWTYMYTEPNQFEWGLGFGASF